MAKEHIIAEQLTEKYHSVEKAAHALTLFDVREQAPDLKKSLDYHV